MRRPRRIAWENAMRSSRLQETLKRNFVFVRFGRRRLFRRCTGLSAFSGRLAPAWRATSEQLHVVGDYAQSRSLLSGLLIVPRIHLEPTFDKNRSAFFQILAGNLGRSSPERDIDKRDFLALFTAVSRISSIYGDAEIANGTAFGRVTHFRITCDISKQKNFVEVRHVALIAKSFRFCHFFWRRLLLVLLESLVMLAVNIRIQFEFGPQPHNQLRIGVYDEVYVIAGIQRPCHVRKESLVHLLHLLNLRPFLLKLGFNGPD